MKDRIPKNASGNGRGETTGRNGELLIADDFLVARLGLGTMRLTGKGIWAEPADRREAIRVVRRAVELGVNFIDTADSYGPHVSEAIIAEALYPYPRDGGEVVGARQVSPYIIEPTILRKKIEDCRDLRRLLLQNETKHHHE